MRPIVALTGAFLSLLLCTAGGSAAHAALTVNALRCEYHTDPLNIVTPRPRLFWQVASSRRGQKQTAYRILVASSPEVLARNEGDQWDSGKVTSPETIQIPYGGKALGSGTQVFWKVCSWDETGAQSTWSRPATWTMGLLRPGDWNAKWIGKAAIPDAAGLGLDGARWIWHKADGANPPGGTRWFRTVINLPADARLDSGQILISVDNSYTVTVNGGKPRVGPQHEDAWRSFQIHDIKTDLKPGPNTILVEAKNEKEGPAGLIAKVIVRTATGPTQQVTGEAWESAENKNGPFTPVTVVATYGAQPWGRLNYDFPSDRVPPYFRKTLTVSRPVKRALLYATALGVYELSLNGKRVGTDHLSPGWTDFNKRVHYLTYDVTSQLRQGKNALGAILGDGWYASYLAFTGRHHYYGGEPKLRLQLAIEYADGQRENVGTDETWKVGTGAITYGDLLMGSTIDSRKEVPGWNTPDFNDSGWKAAVVQQTPEIAIEPQINEPIRETGQVKAIARTEPKKGVYVYNFGQNLVGWVRLKVRGKSGATVRLRHAEFLNPDGTIYTTNLRSARATDTFILKGGAQTLEPTFTFHGFQYVEVTGVDEPPAVGDIVGVVMSSDLAPTIKFESDNQLLNRLVQNIDWGWRGNSLDVPTDCPQRDERAGWTGDAQVFAKTAMFHRFAAPFFSKWMYDVTDGQLPNGGYPDVAPSILGGGNAAWEDAGVVCTYRLYEMYGDTEVIRAHWPSLTKFMDHLAAVSPGGIRPPGSFGDWLLLSGPQRSDIHGTAYYFYSASLMAKMAEAIGQKDEAAKYRGIADQVREAFQKRFVGDDGKITDGGKESQTFYALALAWDLLTEAQRPAATQHLVRLITERGNHLATGFIGTPVLLGALDKAGMSDKANALVLSETYPSWLYQVKIGATTMWERWDGWTPEKGFQDAGMNSFNHYWLGCVGEWLYTGLAGIDTNGPGWSQVTIRPQTKDGPRRVRCTYDSLRGPVTCGWERAADGSLTVAVEIPANVTGTITLPAKDVASVTEGGKPLAGVSGISGVRQEGGNVVCTVGSGKYTFRVARP